MGSASLEVKALSAAEEFLQSGDLEVRACVVLDIQMPGLTGFDVQEMVGVDYLSAGGFRADGLETHQALLKAGIWIIEGLNPKRVRPGRMQLVCLPLKIAGGDGAPARALVRPMDRFGRERR